MSTPVLVGVKLIAKLLFSFLLSPLIIFAFICILCCFFIVLPVLSIFNSAFILYNLLFKLPFRYLELIVVRFCNWVLKDLGYSHEKVEGEPEDCQGSKGLNLFKFPYAYDSEEEHEGEEGGDDRGHEKSKEVCDGKSIRIRFRNWLPFPKTFQAQSFSVNTLTFDEKTKSYDDGLMMHDMVNGNLENEKDFLEKESSNSSIPSTSISTCSKWKWKFLWYSKVPGKTRLFVWRACSDALPTNENLSKKQRTVENRCSVCGQVGESTLHVLRECAFARQVWAVAPISLGDTNGPNSVFEWFSDRSKNLDPYCFALFMTFCWFLWKNRNERSYNKAREIIKSAIDYHTNFITCQESQSRIPQSWIPPSNGYLKLNFDGVAFVEDQAIGIGVIVRNETGEFMVGMAKKLKISWAAPPVGEFAKATAAVEAVQFAVEKGFSEVIIEGDSATVIQAMKTHEEENDDDQISSEYSVLYKNAKRRAASSIRCDFSLVRRTGNKAAHLIARFARDIDFITWTEEPPSFLMPSIINDIPS